MLSQNISVIRKLQQRLTTLARGPGQLHFNLIFNDRVRLNLSLGPLIFFHVQIDSVDKSEDDAKDKAGSYKIQNNQRWENLGLHGAETRAKEYHWHEHHRRVIVNDWPRFMHRILIEYSKDVSCERVKHNQTVG